MIRFIKKQIKLFLNILGFYAVIFLTFIILHFIFMVSINH